MVGEYMDPSLHHWLSCILTSDLISIRDSHLPHNNDTSGLYLHVQHIMGLFLSSFVALLQVILPLLLNQGSSPGFLEKLKRQP